LKFITSQNFRKYELMERATLCILTPPSHLGYTYEKTIDMGSMKCRNYWSRLNSALIESETWDLKALISYWIYVGNREMCGDQSNTISSVIMQKFLKLCNLNINLPERQIPRRMREVSYKATVILRARSSWGAWNYCGIKQIKKWRSWRALKIQGQETIDDPLGKYALRQSVA
jgi:hypothetical protein